MAYKLVILETAEAERREIVEYYLNELDARQAARDFLDEIDSKADAIRRQPELFSLSRMKPLAEKGYHAVFLRHHVMLYTFSDDTVFIGHIFHQSQDYASSV